MNKTERELAKLVKPIFEAEGFVLKKEWNCFIRYTSYGFDRFTIVDQGHLDYDYTTTVGCAFSVRHDAIQSLYNTMGLIYGEEEQKAISTLALHYPFIPWQSRESELKIHQETRAEDMQKVAQIFTEAFKQHALPFYEKYADLREVEAKLNEVPMAKIWPYTAGSVDPDTQAVIGLLCAKAVNPSRYDAIKLAYIDKYIEYDAVPEPYRQRRLKLLDRVARVGSINKV